MKIYIDLEFGSYRIIYSINFNSKIITIILINNRGDIYKKI